MSDARFSIIPGWVVNDPRLKGKDLQVLCMLGRHTSRKHGWCRRSQVKMALELACARSTIFASITRLVEIGAVERREVPSESGRDSAHWYRVIYDREVSSNAIAAWDGEDEEEFGPIGNEEIVSNPCRHTGTPAGIPAPPAGPESAPPAGSGPAPINDSCLTPDAEPFERAREHDDAHGEDNPKTIERAFWKLVKAWPGFDGMPKRNALSEWFKLSSDDRRQAAERFEAWLALLKAQKKSHTPAPATYFSERLWRSVPDKPETPAGPRLAAAYGKLWMAERIADLLRKPYGVIGGLTGFEQRQVQTGQKTAEEVYREKIRRSGWTLVNTMHERAADAKGYPCLSELLPFAEEFRQAHRDGDLYAAWRREHERRGWPFIDDTRPPEWVHFPPVVSGWEDNPDAAVFNALEQFAASVREVRGDEYAA
ncbi:MULTISPECIES: hypothetical protein [unclassified Shinella]|uniref:hypothetical protein n=1 Tax=unclassified Shinella TaxID=2643062 RepID=UPI00234EE615|nr:MULTISPECIES: hypothetical protein [unclassified Shinella]MCO5153367.1 helix-turn-helix domain-containing protein [Shinella sp.]MDC7260546.1 helix-turn-helix domain-containing protein [Shinella sp. HY16]MDC7267441.1 helix-turn-helix domain-containing protein [Shinella sp. YZ44]